MHFNVLARRCNTRSLRGHGVNGGRALAPGTNVLTRAVSLCRATAVLAAPSASAKASGGGGARK
jgi:hypothetical protein